MAEDGFLPSVPRFSQKPEAEGRKPELPPLPLAGEGKGVRAGRLCSRESPLAPNPSPPLGGEGSDHRRRIVAIARSWLGTPYIHQASEKGQGADCLGLIRGVWRELYGAEPEAPPPYTPDWNERHFARGAEPLLDAARRNLEPVAIPRPGDALVFRIVAGGPAKHCGILTEDDRFIHAYAGRSVLESWFSRWWRERLAGAFAFPADPAPADEGNCARLEAFNPLTTQIPPLPRFEAGEGMGVRAE